MVVLRGPWERRLWLQATFVRQGLCSRSCATQFVWRPCDAADRLRAAIDPHSSPARPPPRSITTRQAAALMSQRIVVAIDGWEADSMYPSGHYVRSLGPIGDKDTETVRRAQHMHWRPAQSPHPCQWVHSCGSSARAVVKCIRLGVRQSLAWVYSLVVTRLVYTKRNAPPPGLITPTPGGAAD